MNRMNEVNLSENEPGSNNSLLEKMMIVTKLIRDQDCSEEDLMAAVGNATITVGVMNNDNIKTFKITNKGVEINEEPIRSKTMDCIKRTS